MKGLRDGTTLRTLAALKASLGFHMTMYVYQVNIYKYNYMFEYLFNAHIFFLDRH
jgi:hypothetical protein